MYPYAFELSASAFSYVKNCKNGMSPKETEWWYHDDKASLLTQMLLPPIIFFHASEYILARAIQGPSRGNPLVNLQTK
ncbi:hypothetical protein Bca52824_051953 [Brassica carinata]|uniref:Uncharacterized protein n=1 Tax=Brassica carinata TaxID=52824 RepID=A0A8X7R168_BRACI|nr:hypothetical protein Bca52824_051953 [Brassica carinata]